MGERGEVARCADAALTGDDRHGVGIPDTALPQMAERHDQAPALVSDAMRMARLCNGGEAVVSRVLDAAARLAKGGADSAPSITIS